MREPAIAFMIEPVLVLDEVTPDNYAATLALSVAPSQQRLIAPVVQSLADAFVWKSWPRVAREGAVHVGFVLAYPFEWKGERAINIVRFMIDRAHQGRGLGHALMEATLAWLDASTPTPRRHRITTKVDNAPAQHLFRRWGFAGDEIVGGEVVLWRDAG